MSIHSVCANASVLRILSHTQRLKWASSFNKNFLTTNKVFQCFCEPVSRIVCTDSNLQSYNYEIQDPDKEQQVFYLQDNFLKENFNIVDSRYFRLVTLPSECNDLEQLLRTNEFKKVLSRSPFLYDVSVVGNSRNVLSETSAFRQHVCEDVLLCENTSVNKESTRGLDNTVFLFASNSDAKQNMQGKASEEQLLHIIDKLTYSLINFFEKPHDYSIYHNNIVFQNNIKGVTIKGLNAYAQSMYIMRIYGFLHFAKVRVEILKVTHHIEDGTVRVRWRVNGLPRHKLVIMLWKYKAVSWHGLPEQETQWLDGFSVFSVGDDGLIYKHICDKMIPDDEQLLSKRVDLKSKVLGLLGLTPRGPAAATINPVIPYYQNQDHFSSKKFT